MIILDSYVSQITLDIIGYIATVIGILAGVPQLIISIKSRNTKNLSMTMIAMMLTGNICWLVYAILRNIYPMIIGNSIVIPLWTVLFFIKIKNLSKIKNNVNE